MAAGGHLGMMGLFRVTLASAGLSCEHKLCCRMLHIVLWIMKLEIPELLINTDK